MAHTVVSGFLIAAGILLVLGFLLFMSKKMRRSSKDDEALLLAGERSDSVFSKPGNGRGLRGGSFSLQFAMPYKRDAIWAELVKSTDPLGSEAVALTLVKGTELALGAIRKVDFSSPVRGSATSEVTEFDPPQRLRWKQLEASGGLQLAGNPTAKVPGADVVAFEVAGPLVASTVASSGPEIVIEMAELPGGGTHVRLTYEFQSLRLPRALCWLSPLAPTLLRMLMARSLPSLWKGGMARRGHTPLPSEAEAATKVQAVVKGRSSRREVEQMKQGRPNPFNERPPPVGPLANPFNERPAAAPKMMIGLDKKAERTPDQKKKDQDEEAAMKEAMRQKALEAQAAKQKK